MASLRKFTKKLLILANAVAALLFLLACLNSFLEPSKWWLISLLGLVFPLLFLVVLGFGICWLFLDSRRWAWLSVLTLILGWKNIHVFFAFHPQAGFQAQKAPGAIRLLTWNVRSWDEFITKKPGSSGHRSKMIRFIAEQDPDLVCFQEFFESHDPRTLASTIPFFRDSLHFPYYFFSRDYSRRDGSYETGVIIFSKFPLTDTTRLRYGFKNNARGSESLIAADLDLGGRKVRLYTTHLQSVLFHSKDFRDIEIIKNVEDSVLQASRSIVKKLKRAYTLRSGQADLVRRELDSCPYPVIICGDFNDIPNSYTYFCIRGDRQDAFLAKGFGIGRTYVHLSPTLRIDYIMADKQFNILQCRKFPLPYSDHYPIVADLQIPPLQDNK
jgi:endonuclease/exonuclease/phosphatase family metal-dependent hydrolase